MLSHQKLHFIKPLMSGELMYLGICVCSVLQCNLPEAGMWVTVHAALQAMERQQWDIASVFALRGLA